MLEKRRCAILRQWFHLPQSTPSLCMLHELGLEPLVHTYVRQAVRWWNCLVAMPDASPYKPALRQNVADGVQGWACNFSGALYKCMRTVLQAQGHMQSQLAQSLRGLEPFDTEVVDAALQQRYAEHVLSLEGTYFRSYFAGMQSHVVGQLPCWYSFAVSHGVLLRVLKFRLGRSSVRVNVGRYTQPALPRAQRTCQRCHLVCLPQQQVPVDDENHCLLDCACPALTASRERVIAAVRRVWRTAPLNTAKQFFEAIDHLQAKRAHREKHKCVFFVAKCFKEAFACVRDPVGYCEVEPEYSLSQFFDDFNSDDVLQACDVLADVDSEEEVQSVAHNW